jgi:hypothetical protein
MSHILFEKFDLRLCKKNLFSRDHDTWMCIVIARAITEKAYLTTDGARSHHVPWVDVTSSDGVMS